MDRMMMITSNRYFAARASFGPAIMY